MEQVIGIKQLHKDMKKIYEGVQQGHSFLVMRNITPMFRIEPVKKSMGKKYTMNDMLALQCSSADQKNASKEVDKIVYGV